MSPFYKTVGFQWKDNERVPVITLRGEKLREIGFDIGSCVAVQASEGELNLKKCPEPVVREVKKRELEKKVETIQKEIQEISHE